MRWMVIVVLSGACGGLDNDASVGAIEQQAGSGFSISLGNTSVEASPLLPSRTVTITGYPHQPVAISLDRATAGVLDTSTLTLDANGQGSVRFTPCAGVAVTCLGPATITLAIGSPKAIVAAQSFTLVYPAHVGEVGPCLSDDNVMFLHGNDFIVDGTYQSSPSDPWLASPAIDQLAFEVGTHASGNYFLGRFSLLQLPQALTPGIYDHAEREAFATAAHPGIDISGRGHGCNIIAGRFQIHEYIADPVYGTVYSATISFEQACDPEPAFTGQPTTKLMAGCFHYEQTPPAPVTPLTPDPAKISVQVNSIAFDGKPDATAHAVFMDQNGAIVLDTPVNAFGQAEVALPNGGSVTTIQAGSNNYVHINTYRGLATGDHVVVNPPSGRTGTMDQMLVTFTPPAGVAEPYVGLVTACSDGSRISAGRMAVNFFDGCRTPLFSVFAFATPPDGPAQYLWNSGFAHVANRNVALAGAWAPMSSATLTLANVPDGLPPIVTQWMMKIESSPYVMGGGSVVGNQSITVRRAPGAGNGTIVSAGYSPQFLVNEMRSVVDTGSPAAVTVDFAAQPIPMPSAVQQTTTGASWSQTAGAADVRDIYYRAFVSSSRVIWRVREPNDGQAHTTLPSLPAAYAAYDPAANSNTQPSGVMVTYTDFDTVQGFTLVPPTSSHRAHSVNASSFSLQFPF
jgi:hypothetical protein